MSKPQPNLGSRFRGRLRTYLLAGLIVLGPSVVTVWALWHILSWFDNLLRPYLRFGPLADLYVPGLGVVATLLVLIVTGWMASWIGARWVLGWWDRLLTAIPGVGILYGSTKSLGEAIFTRKSQAFRQVVLVQWPHPGLWRIGFVTGEAGPGVREKLPEHHDVVFIPHTPNPASGFVHYVPRSEIVHLDWAVEDGLKVVVSGGVIQPDVGPAAESGKNDTARN